VDSLAAIDHHLEVIDKELRTQLTRMAQIQQQVDQLRAALKRTIVLRTMSSAERNSDAEES